MSMEHRKAFSLVELLVVIAIISVLAGLLMPALEEAIESARIVSCSGQLRQQYQLAEAYSENYKSMVVPFANYVYGDNPYSLSSIKWLDAIRINEGWDFSDTSALLFACPSGEEKDMSISAVRYIYNWDGSYAMKSYQADSNPGTPGGYTIAQIPKPSQKLYIVDYGTGTHIQTSTSLNRVYYMPGSGINPAVRALAPADLEAFFVSNTSFRIWDFLEGRHGNKVNIGYYDGHVSTYDAADAGYEQHFNYSSSDSMFNTLK